MPTDPRPHIVNQDRETRIALCKQFIESVIFGQYRQLVRWKSVTGQTSQLDSGYIGQQLLSILTGVPGTGGRGKGIDLEDGSEVKTASSISGIDIPRWNNDLKTAAKLTSYLNRTFIYFVLFDTVVRNQPFPFRIRIWKVNPRTDRIFRRTVRAWSKTPNSGNFQLHPPCWEKSNVATNNSGNMELPLMFETIQKEIGDIDFMIIRQFVNPRKGCKRV